jgi:glycosyltransferase involved in cell wall biosynthesis
MNVCMLAYTFYESDNRVMRYAETLAAYGDRVDVIALRSSDGEQESTVNGVNVFGIQTRILNESGKTSYLFRLLKFLVRSAWLLWRRQRTIQYDLIHVHSVPDFLVFAALMPKLAGAKVILDIHDILPELYASKFEESSKSLTFKSLLLVERVSARFADHVIIANDLWRNRLIQRSIPEAKCTTIMNYPDCSIFRRSGRTRHDGRFVILYPGSLNWHQGLDIAIRALAKICDRVPHVDLHIYGNGPEEQNLRTLVSRLGLDGRVIFRDYVSLREVAPIMENADLAVVPKRSNAFSNEAFSTKTLEFMAMGVPLIVAATDIDKYYFQDSQVMFFRPDDDEDLAAAMLNLIESPELRKELIGRGLKFAEINDWERKKNLYLDIVSSLTNQTHQSVEQVGAE